MSEDDPPPATSSSRQQRRKYTRRPDEFTLKETLARTSDAENKGLSTDHEWMEIWLERMDAAKERRAAAAAADDEQSHVQ